MTSAGTKSMGMGLGGQVEFVSDFDLPAKAYRCQRTRGVCTGDSRYLHVGTLFQAWQAGIMK